jgi:hypothetical protein
MPETFSIEGELTKVSGLGARAEHAARLEALGSRLQSMPGNLRVRDDSRLAWKYATDLCADNEADVCTEMALTQMLYEQRPPYTDYRELVQVRLRSLANAMKTAYPTLPWRIVWQETRRHGMDIVKILALDERCTVSGVAKIMATLAQPQDWSEQPAKVAIDDPEGDEPAHDGTDENDQC